MTEQVEISKRLVLINSASSIAVRFLNVSVLVWVHQYLLNRITAEEYAIYPVVASIMIFAPLFTSFLTGGISRFVIEAYARGDERRATEIVSSIFPLLLVGGLMFLGVGGLLAWYFDRLMTIIPERIWDARLMLGMLVIGFVAQVVALPFTVGFHVRQRFVLWNLIEVAMEAVRITILFLLLFGVSTRVIWIVVASVSAQLAALVAKVIASSRMAPGLRFRPSLFRWETGRQLLSFGLWTTFGQLTVMIHRGADTLILNKLATPIDVNGFYVGSMLDNQINAMSATASAPVQPALTAMHSTGDRARLGNAFLRGGRYALWATLLIACPLMVFRHPLIDLYIGETYAVAATVILLLMSTYPFSYSNTMLPKIAIATAQVSLFFAAAFGVQLVNLGLTLYLVGPLKLGAKGSALSTFVTTLIGQPLIFWPMGLKMTRVGLGRYYRETLLPGLAPSVAGLAAWIALLAFTPSDSWFWLGVNFALGAVVYVLALLVFCLQPGERRDLTQAIQKVRSKF